MGYEELFPPYDMEWHGKATKRFANPFVDNKFDRVDVDPVMLSNAAVACGYTIRDFYEKPELGIHCLAYIYQLYDLLPVSHWFYSTPWLKELGMELTQKDTLPPIAETPIISEPGQVDDIEVPDVDQVYKEATPTRSTRGCTPMCRRTSRRPSCRSPTGSTRSERRPTSAVSRTSSCGPSLSRKRPTSC